MNDENYLICAGTKVETKTLEEVRQEYGDITDIVDQLPNAEIKDVIKKIFPGAKCTPVVIQNNTTNITAYKLQNPQEVLKALLNKNLHFWFPLSIISLKAYSMYNTNPTRTNRFVVIPLL